MSTQTNTPKIQFVETDYGCDETTLPDALNELSRLLNELEATMKTARTVVSMAQENVNVVTDMMFELANVNLEAESVESNKPYCMALW